MAYLRRTCDFVLQPAPPRARRVRGSRLQLVPCQRGSRWQPTARSGSSYGPTVRLAAAVPLRTDRSVRGAPRLAAARPFLSQAATCANVSVRASCANVAAG